MIKILLLEDTAEKLKNIKEIILENQDIKLENIVTCVCSTEARRELYKNEFDLFITDLLVPENFGDIPSADESLSLLYDINHDNEMNKPLNIIGITAFEDKIKEYEETFNNDSWHLISYSESTHNWKDSLKRKIDYMVGIKKHNVQTDQYIFDIGIVCALNDPEFAQILKLSKWEPVLKKNSSIQFYKTTFERDKKVLRVIAACINRMGMVPTGILTAQMIEFFRPKYLAMTGIAAGIQGEVELGDIMVVEHSWDYNSGKISIDDSGNKKFHVDLRQEKLDEDLYNSMNTLKNDKSFLNQIYNQYQGNKPRTYLEIKIGHIASGAAVIANNDVVEGIKQQGRKLLGIEMEAYGLFYAANNATNPKPKPLVIKSVCDFADEKKNDDIQDYAAYTSAQVLYEFALRYL